MATESPEGTSLTSAATSPLLRSAVAMRPGALFSVDILRPDVPVAIYLGKPDAVDTSIRELAAAVNDGTPGSLTLPQAWTRCAIVGAVDRWLDAQIDETLLVADHALAHNDAGDTAAARALLTPDIIDRLYDYSTELADAGAIPAALRRELARFEDVFVDDVDGLELDPNSTLPGALSAPTLLEHRAPELDDLFAGIVADFAHPPRVARVDVLHVPARVVGPEIVLAQDDSDNVTVKAPAYRGMTADEPSAHRLLCRLVERDTGRILSFSTFTFTDDGFSGTLALRGRTLDDVTVDVFDGNVASTPRISDAEVRDLNGQIAIQRAFTAARLAAALQAIGDPTSRAQADVATLELDQLPTDPTSISQYRVSLEATLAVASDASAPFRRRNDGQLGPHRSLLCELDAALRLSASR